jgi:hypothetical protein
MKVLVLGLYLVLMYSSSILAQDICEGNFDYDEDVDGGDAFTFKVDFGRSVFSNPCPFQGPGPVTKTGQTTCYRETGEQRDCAGTGEDGDHQKGIGWPNPRFTVDGDIVKDNLTGLTWLRDANCIATNYPNFDNDETVGDGMVTWQHALDFVSGINDGTYSNCGAGQLGWRLPNIREFQSLVDYGVVDPALPEGHPFINTQSSYYWLSTTIPDISDYAWSVDMIDGGMLGDDKLYGGFMWPVRGGR